MILARLDLVNYGRIAVGRKWSVGSPMSLSLQVMGNEFIGSPHGSPQLQCCFIPPGPTISNYLENYAKDQSRIMQTAMNWSTHCFCLFNYENLQSCVPFLKFSNFLPSTAQKAALKSNRLRDKFSSPFITFLTKPAASQLRIIHVSRKYPRKKGDLCSLLFKPMFLSVSTVFLGPLLHQNFVKIKISLK